MENISTFDVPEFFLQLENMGCIGIGDILCSDDGFFAVGVSISDILASRGITSIPDGNGGILKCSLFFDDWYPYAVRADRDFVYSLFKMREQEHDLKMGLYADGDIPGVTISFIETDVSVITDCLANPVYENQRRIDSEINRTAAHRRQKHHARLKEYFLNPQSRGSYLAALMYTDYIASLACGGTLAVPDCYADLYREKGKNSRITRFIEDINEKAGRIICDHSRIMIGDSSSPTEYERLVLLASHCGNTSFHSFAAEVRFHAFFLGWWARLPLPIIGRSVYDSAVRADMSIGDTEFTGPTPYYRENSFIVKKQRLLHPDFSGYLKGISL